MGRGDGSAGFPGSVQLRRSMNGKCSNTAPGTAKCSIKLFNRSDAETVPEADAGEQQRQLTKPGERGSYSVYAGHASVSLLGFGSVSVFASSPAPCQSSALEHVGTCHKGRSRHALHTGQQRSSNRTPPRGPAAGNVTQALYSGSTSSGPTHRPPGCQPLSAFISLLQDVDNIALMGQS